MRTGNDLDQPSYIRLNKEGLGLAVPALGQQHLEQSRWWGQSQLRSSCLNTLQPKAPTSRLREQTGKQTSTELNCNGNTMDWPLFIRAMNIPVPHGLHY